MFHLTAYLGSETRDPTAGNTQWLDEQLSRVALGADRSKKTSNWLDNRHRGIAATGGCNHRGSVVRLLVGKAIKSRDALFEPMS
jgi:hypothetical protein